MKNLAKSSAVNDFADVYMLGAATAQQPQRNEFGRGGVFGKEPLI